MAGTYTQIVDIVAPSSAVAGETVPVTIKIKNIWTFAITVMRVVYIDGIYFEPDNGVEADIPAGATHSFPGHFTMPDKSITIEARSYYYGVDHIYHLDDTKTKDVSLGVAPEGTITKMELEYDEARADIPAYDIPQGNRGLIHVWGRNDTQEAQQMGIAWAVRDPDGLMVEAAEHSEWEAWPYTGAGKTHEFIGGRFNLDKVGTYRIAISLYMNPDSPTVVDSYSGTLCTVAAVVPEPEFAGFSITEYTKR